MAEHKKLDRARSYGTVYGDPNCGFFQDGKPYCHDGTLYVPPVLPTRTDDIARPPEARPQVSDERRAAQSEAMKKLWAERREALAAARSSDDSPSENASP